MDFQYVVTELIDAQEDGIVGINKEFGTILDKLECG